MVALLFFSWTLRRLDTTESISDAAVPLHGWKWEGIRLGLTKQKSEQLARQKLQKCEIIIVSSRQYVGLQGFSRKTGVFHLSNERCNWRHYLCRADVAFRRVPGCYFKTAAHAWQIKSKNKAGDLASHQGGDRFAACWGRLCLINLDACRLDLGRTLRIDSALFSNGMSWSGSTCTLILVCNEKHWLRTGHTSKQQIGELALCQNSLQSSTWFGLPVHTHTHNHQNPTT